MIHFLSLRIQEQVLTDKSSHQLLYYIFREFGSNQEQILMFHHFLKYFYDTFVKSYIDQKQILTDKVIFQLHAYTFVYSETNSNISGFFITVPILLSKDL